MTPQAPIQERPIVEQPITPPYTPPYTPSPSPWQPAPVYMPRPAPMPTTVPTAPQRLALAIVSLALMIPLVAITINFASPTSGVVPVWIGVIAGLIGLLLLGLVVLGVNIVFNWDLLRSKR
jgi:hypothetical protein